MDINFVEYLPVIGVAIVLIAIQYFMRRRTGSVSSHEQVVQRLLSDIRINLRLVDVLVNGEQIKRFSVNGWRMCKNNIDFLKQPLQSALKEACEMAEDYTQQVESAKKSGSVNNVATINTEKMKEKLKVSKAGLEDWLMEKTGTTDPGGKGGILSSLFGRW
jgi:hypothetical protein